jgi:hypothetical protein
MANDDYEDNNEQQIVNAGSGGVAIGGSGTQYNYVFNSVLADKPDARKLFLASLRSREEFMSNFLTQALRQANLTFSLSVYFMTLGGIIILVAAMLAITRFAGSPSHGVALISGASGLVIGASGAAFSRRADKSRKHLAQQAAMMQTQIVNEQKFSQVIDLLTGINDPQLNDQARISLSMRLMGEIDKNNEGQPNLTSELPIEAVSRVKKRRGMNP